MDRWAGPETEPDRYLLVLRHSRGGEGELWRAELRLGSIPIPVAVKIGHPESDAPGHDEPQPTPASPSSGQRRATRRWEEQTELLRTLNHPNLVRVREVFEGPGPHPQGASSFDDEPRLYLVMNWVEGPTIARWVQSECPTPARIVAMLTGIAGALDYLHTGMDTVGTAVLHRDVKPANLIVTGDVVTLVDFGLARLLDPSAPSMTMAGTPAFLAPEVITDQQFSAASDRYAFAGTLYQLLTGSSPNVFAPERMRTALRLRAVDHTGRLADLLLAGMHMDPDQRPESLSGWLDEIGAELPAESADPLTTAPPTNIPWTPPERDPNLPEPDEPDNAAMGVPNPAADPGRRSDEGLTARRRGLPGDEPFEIDETVVWGAVSTSPGAQATTDDEPDTVLRGGIAATPQIADDPTPSGPTRDGPTSPPPHSETNAPPDIAQRGGHDLSLIQVAVAVALTLLVAVGVTLAIQSRSSPSEADQAAGTVSATSDLDGTRVDDSTAPNGVQWFQVAVQADTRRPIAPCRSDGSLPPPHVFLALDHDGGARARTDELRRSDDAASMVVA